MGATYDGNGPDSIAVPNDINFLCEEIVRMLDLREEFPKKWSYQSALVLQKYQRFRGIRLKGLIRLVSFNDNIQSTN